MKFAAGSLSSLLLVLPFLSSLATAKPALSQPITPAADGTGTAVTPEGNTFNIQGGSLSSDGANLFHSFQKFGLSEGQVANFISNPDIRNILGRVVGGDASYINGLIRVSGGSSNLFLMNPAGILFGPNASLNVPADFTATTATGIGFGSGWFNAVGSNDYTILVGTPSAFSFALPQAGAIVNEGNLTLTPGSNLALLGGTAISTGTLASPGGNVTIAAVPGESVVRLSQQGHVLSLDIEPVALTGAEGTESQGTGTPLSLPQLLTGRPDFGHASALSVSENGEVSLTGSGVRIPAESGTAIVAGNIDVSAPSGVGGAVSVLGSRVGLAGASINASGATAGGTVLIGGDDRGRSTGILPVHPLNASDTFVSSDSAINADALLNGDGGRVIIWSDKTTHFLGQISARGGSNSGNGGVVEVSGKEHLIFRGTVDVSAALGTTGTLLLGSENITIADGDAGESDSQVTDSQVLFEDGTGTFTISETQLESLDGKAEVKLEASDNITVSDLTDNELTFKPGTGTIALTADADKNGTGTFSMNAGDTIRAEGRNVTVEAVAITAGNIDTSSEVGSGGAISLNATSDIITGSLQTKADGTGSGGDISINSSAGGIDTAGGELFSYSIQGNGGSVNLTASGEIKTGNIGSSSSGTGSGGNIAITSSAGGIDTTLGELNSSSNEGNGGSVTLRASGDIKAGYVSSASSGTASGGNITLTSSAGGIDSAGSLLNSSSVGGNGGSVTLTAAGDIKTALILSNSSGTGTGGNISLTSSAGGIDAAGGWLDSSSSQGNGGSLSLSASGLITTGDIKSSGFLRGGDITITSQLSDIINGGFLEFSSESGTPGDVTINAYAGSISTGTLSGARNVTIAGGGKDEPIGASANASVTSGADKINTLAGNVTLAAHNDITVSEPIQTSSITSLELIAGRSININANIDTSGSNGDIALRANNNSANLNYRASGPGSVTMAPGTALNAGSGNIVIELGRLAEVGDITLSDINTAGALTVNAATGNILRSSPDSLITAGSAFFQTERLGTGGIGSLAEPLRISVRNLEATAGSGGAFFESPLGGLTVGGATDLPLGILTSGGGEVSVSAAGDITIAESVRTASVLSGDAGNITFSSTGGVIDTRAVSLNSSSTQGNGGAVNLSASGDIQTGEISSSSDTGTGGNISLNSSAGGIDTAGGQLSTHSNRKDGGAVSLSASGEIKTSNIESFSSTTGTGGKIEITSSAGAIDTTGGWLSSYSGAGNGGAVNLSASGDIQTGEIRSVSFATGSGGEIALNSSAGAIDTGAGRLSSYSLQGNGAAVTLTASGDITTGHIASYSYGTGTGGDIAINSSAGTINTAGGGLNSYSSKGNGGSVTLTAFGDIQTGQIASMAGYQGDINWQGEGEVEFTPVPGSTGSGGNITIESSNGAANTSAGSLNTMSLGGAAGNVTINAAGHVETASIRSEGFSQGGNLSIRSDSPNSIAVGGNLDTYSTNGTAGDITLSSPGRITLTGDITSYGQTESGDITVTSESNTVETNSITTQSGTGPSGNITINGNNIAAGNLDSIGSTGAGNIEVSAGGNVTTLNIQSRTDEGNSGNIDVSAGNDISTGDQTTSTGEGDSGDITNTAGGDVTAGNQTTSATNGNSGNITNTAGGNVTAGNQTTSATNGNSGNITNTAGGNINTGNQTSSAIGGTAGNITNSAGGSISTGNLTSAGTQGSGQISLNSGTGEINTGEIRTGSGEVSNASNSAAGNPSAPALNSTPVGNQDVSFPPPIQNSIIQSVPAQSSIITTLSGNTSTKAGSNSPLSSNRSAQQIVGSLSTVSSSPLAANAAEAVAQLEQRRDKEFADYFGENLSNQLTNPESIREALATIASQTGNRSAIIYVTALPEELEVVLLTPEGKFIRKIVPAAKRDDLFLAVWDFREILADATQRNTASYLQPAQQLYQWLIAPIEAELQAAKIDTLLFSMDAGLRSLPVAALHDGKQFLVEKYSLALIPSVSLMDTRYQPVQGTKVLAMGASEFTNQQPLPAVPVELSEITQKLWQGKAFLNQEFTRENLIAQRSNYPYRIIHLATHGEFQAGKLGNSYIQLWQDKLRLDEVRNLRLNSPPVELLVLSACRTALGDDKAELGFAGFAVAAGVKTAVASLWYVSDAGTLGLMTEFYNHLSDAKIKAEALRQAQVAMIRGEVRIEGGELRGSGTRSGVSLPAELRKEGSHNLKHPYYWSGFTMIGSPW